MQLVIRGVAQLVERTHGVREVFSLVRAQSPRQNKATSLK